MNYQVKATSIAKSDAKVQVRQSNIGFGTTKESADLLPNPAELFLSSFAACILKNVERFSTMMKFTYTKAELIVIADRLDSPPRMDHIYYELTIYSEDIKFNKELLHKNIKRHGTIYNTVALSSLVSGNITCIANV